MLWLILSFLFSAFIMIILDFNYIGISYIIIYIGAIIILFLFVIMMVHDRHLSHHRHSFFSLLIFFCFVFFTFNPFPQFASFWSPNYFILFYSFNDIHLIAHMIYLYFPSILFLLTYLLLILLIGVLNILT